MSSAKVDSATNPEFGAATVAAVETFTFDPATRESVAVPTVIQYNHVFVADQTNDSHFQEFLGLVKYHPGKFFRWTGWIKN